MRLMGDELRDALCERRRRASTSTASVVHSFENRVLLHLASGRLVITELLEPLFGLEPGIDFLAGRATATSSACASTS